MQAPLAIIDTASTAATMLHPVRQRVLEAFREPSTAADVARRLELPRQRLGHHVRRLQDEGRLVKVGERRKGNFVEQVLQTDARAYLLAPQALGPVGPDIDAIADRFSSAYLVAGAAQLIRDIAVLRDLAAESGKRLATISLETEIRFASPAAQAQFAEELATALRDLARKYHDAQVDGGRSFRFFIGGHPAVAGTQPPSTDEGERLPARSNDE